MDIVIALNFLILTVVALFFPFMTLTPSQVKRYLMFMAMFFIVPLVIILTGNYFGWLNDSYTDVILLQQGDVFSISISIGYGIIAGLLLYGLKTAIFSFFSRKRSDEASQEQREE